MSRTSEDELDFMSKPEKWPHVWVLPLLRRKEEKKGLELLGMEHGFLVQMNSDPDPGPPEPIVYLDMIYDLKPGWREVTPTAKYESLQAIVDDGWYVD
jgi:hypothetical protein